MEEGIGLLGGVKHYLEYQAHAHSNSATVGLLCTSCVKPHRKTLRGT